VSFSRTSRTGRLLVNVGPLAAGAAQRLVRRGEQDHRLPPVVTALLATTHAPLAVRQGARGLARAAWGEDA
jgi:hypothetical protein